MQSSADVSNKMSFTLSSLWTMEKNIWAETQQNQVPTAHSMQEDSFQKSLSPRTQWILRDY